MRFMTEQNEGLVPSERQVPTQPIRFGREGHIREHIRALLRHFGESEIVSISADHHQRLVGVEVEEGHILHIEGSVLEVFNITAEALSHASGMLRSNWEILTEMETSLAA